MPPELQRPAIVSSITQIRTMLLPSGRRRRCLILRLSNISVVILIHFTSATRSHHLQGIPGKACRFAVSVFSADHFFFNGDTHLLQIRNPGSQTHDPVFLHSFKACDRAVIFKVSLYAFALCHVVSPFHLLCVGRSMPPCDKFRIGKGFYPIAQRVPFVQLVILPGVVDVLQHGIIELHRAPLVEAGWEKLDKLPPVFLVVGLKELLAVIIQDVYCPKKKIIGHVVIVAGQLFNVFMAEIIHVKLLRMDFVHGGAAICNRSDFVGVKLFPPIERRGNVQRDGYHPQELSVILTGSGERLHKLEIIFADAEMIFVRIAVFGRFVIVHHHSAIAAPIRFQTRMTVHSVPAILRIPHPPNGGCPAVGFNVFNRQHIYTPVLPKPLLPRSESSSLSTTSSGSLMTGRITICVIFDPAFRRHVLPLWL
nr:MAG TPA: hypothetical protein [Caudoviricetes sp.]